MASTFGSTSWKEHVGVHPPCWRHLLHKSFYRRTWFEKISPKICEWMEVEISSNVKLFKLYPTTPQ